MNARERRLASLAALFAPERAAALLGRVQAGGAAEALDHAERLSRGSRRERLQALASAMTVDTESARARADGAARLERPRVAAILQAVAAGEMRAAASAVLLRLCRERVGR